MFTELQLANSRTRSRLHSNLRRELINHQRKHPRLWSGILIPIFHFLDDLPSEIPRSTRLKWLQKLCPYAELQTEYFLEPHTQPDDMGVTFPVLDSNAHRTKTSARYAAALCERMSKPTWKQFCESSVAPLFMQHIDTVTFAARMKTPSYFYVVVNFDAEASIHLEGSFFGFEDAYERLDVEYIKQEVERVARNWAARYKDTAMTFDVVEMMAGELRKMYQEMVW
ncbi:unnamed protein product [Aureobasidium vineae]|uniref:Uncharacterized protein n=1 Tax=Aureobasidium vineae TaxID=2773715 RepID=A0A9N8JT59_9PEZI|nr:unnamed protein product [Aureobasidium vineae]